MNVDAIVLAGADNDGKLGAVSSATHEALIFLHGRPMIQYVIDGLQASQSVRRIVVVGPVAHLEPLGGFDGVELVECGRSMVENIRIGIDHLKPEGPVLIVTSDIPLIHGKAIDDFVRRCDGVKADIYYPIVEKSRNEALFPGVKRTYVRLKDGVYTGGNLALIEPAIVPACEEMIGRAVAMRKKPWQLSRLLGLKFIIKFLFNRLTMREIEDRVGMILGFRGVGVVSPYPEVGIDVDKPEDLALAEKALAARAERGGESVGGGEARAPE